MSDRGLFDRTHLVVVIWIQQRRDQADSDSLDAVVSWLPTRHDSGRGRLEHDDPGPRPGFGEHRCDSHCQTAGAEGRAAAYASSRLRVITAALNPSKAEFPPDEPFSRFPLSADVDGPNEAYLAALDTYFKTNPYTGWFSSYEALLNGFDASYYPGAENTALHTDLCSPVATDPTWSRIGSDARAGLIEDGVPIWHLLVETLRPDVIVISVARAHLKRIEFQSGEPFEIAHLAEEGHSRPYVTEGRWIDVGGGHRSLMVFGQAANRPFGLVSHMHKTGIGGRIAAYLRDVGG